jgi:hypothetical protein
MIWNLRTINMIDGWDQYFILYWKDVFGAKFDYVMGILYLNDVTHQTYRTEKTKLLNLTEYLIYYLM